MSLQLVAKIKHCPNISSDCISIKDSHTLCVDKKDHDLLNNGMLETFQFDTILPAHCVANQQYGEILLDKVDQLQHGKSLLFMVYGQYKSGKTHTLFGKNNTDPQERGLLPRTIQHMLNMIAKLNSDERKFNVSLRILRIFNDKLYDVLSADGKPKDGDIRIVDRKTKHGHITWTKNVKIQQIARMQDFDQIMATISSKASLPPFNHAIYTLYLEYQTNGKKSIYAQLHFVELASSDKLSHLLEKKKTHLFGTASPDGNPQNFRYQQTNKFLHQTLESMVTIFTFIRQNVKFPPFRNNKLLHILKDCFIDSTANIVLLLTLIPSYRSLQETLKTLHFGEQIYQQTGTKLADSNSNLKSRSNSNSKGKVLMSSGYQFIESEAVTDTEREEEEVENGNIVQLLHDVQQLIAKPLQIRASDIEEVQERVEEMVVQIRRHNRDRMRGKNTIHRLENENEMLREHIEKQNELLAEFKQALQNVNQQQKCTPLISESLSPESVKSRNTKENGVNVDSKINDIEQRLREHAGILQSLQKEIEGADTESTSDYAAEPSKQQPCELEKVLAERHKFENLHL